MPTDVDGVPNSRVRRSSHIFSASRGNPIMGTLWMTACNVFIDELRRIRTEPAHGAWSLQMASEQEREKEMLASLHDGLDALSAFARERAY
ncbi:hypothetical protein MSAN_00213200 [Mycena sanguinolenta]|uniref:Uncharacterized protein n=1 Tax=Mycena sanguinolenta TaxID=230812 RepID=A0A8H6ZF82_9AGAR|nr:hypothetical protein MSAN_00213200 [Mycena sanguinolenta]